MDPTWRCRPVVTFTSRGLPDKTSGSRTTGENKNETRVVWPRARVLHHNTFVSEGLSNLTDGVLLLLPFAEEPLGVSKTWGLYGTVRRRACG